MAIMRLSHTALPRTTWEREVILSLETLLSISIFSEMLPAHYCTLLLACCALITIATPAPHLADAGSLTALRADLDATVARTDANHNFVPVFERRVQSKTVCASHASASIIRDGPSSKCAVALVQSIAWLYCSLSASGYPSHLAYNLFTTAVSTGCNAPRLNGVLCW